MAFLCANLPHVEVFVKKEYLYDFEKGHGELVEGVWVTVKSIQGKALYFETYIPEYGAVYDKLPLSAFVWKKDFEGDLELEELELWDCFSYDITVIEKRLLKGQRSKYFSPSKKWHEGIYMFTIDSCNPDSNRLNTTFSEAPTQHKSFNILKLNNGYFAAQPNNRMLILDKSYTPKTLKFPDFKVSSIEYSVEDKEKTTFGDDTEFFYGINNSKKEKE